MYNASVLCRFQRPPGVIPSSMLGLEAYTGSLDDFGFEDYLNGNDTIYLCTVVSVVADFFLFFFPFITKLLFVFFLFFLSFILVNVSCRTP